MCQSTEPLPGLPSKRPHRIAFCITELDVGGAEQQFVRLVTATDREAFTPEVICLAGRGKLIAVLERDGIPVTCLDARGRFDAGVVIRLCRHFRRSQPELVQTFLFHANIAGRVAARLAGVPIVVSGIRVAERRRWHLICDRMTDRWVDRHVCVSRDVAEFAHQVGKLPAAKLVVIPNAVDAERFARATRADLQQFDIPNESRVILFVGRLDEQKNPNLLLEAFRQIAEEMPDTFLFFVGTGPLLPSLKEAASDLGRRVIFTGYRDDTPSLMKAATCLALPSRWEGMPNVVLEAMASGTPVVASNAEGISELLQHGSSGQIVASHSAGSWVSALKSTLNSPSLAAEKTQSIIPKQFTEESMVRSYRDLHQSLLNDLETRSPKADCQRRR